MSARATPTLSYLARGHSVAFPQAVTCMSIKAQVFFQAFQKSLSVRPLFDGLRPYSAFPLTLSPLQLDRHSSLHSVQHTVVFTLLRWFQFFGTLYSLRPLHTTTDGRRHASSENYCNAEGGDGVGAETPTSFCFGAPSMQQNFEHLCLQRADFPV